MAHCAAQNEHDGHTVLLRMSMTGEIFEHIQKHPARETVGRTERGRERESRREREREREREKETDKEIVRDRERESAC